MHGSFTKKPLTLEEREKLLKYDKLVKDDWETLSEVMSILKKFYDLTKHSKGTSLRGN
jgi:hypothetical protein